MSGQSITGLWLEKIEADTRAKEREACAQKVEGLGCICMLLRKLGATMLVGQELHSTRCPVAVAETLRRMA